jgi:UDP-glucose 6-dehydrogenase
MNSVLIIGYGVVGKNLSIELAGLRPDVYDKYSQRENTKRNIRYDFAFVCVDTPYRGPGDPCDTSEVLNAIRENDAEIFIVKSAVLPGTVDMLREETGKRVVVSPEYYGGTHHCNNFNFDFTVVGGERQDCVEVVQLLQNVYDGRHVFRMTDAITAELVKYMENSWLATKVTFCVQFYKIAEAIGVSYEELRELFVLDPRVNPSHTFVHRDKPYWDSHCLNKDVRSISLFRDSVNAGHNFLSSVIAFNEEQIKTKKL